MEQSTRATANVGGRPRTLSDMRRKCYSLEADQEQFLVEMAGARDLSESHLMRQIIDGFRKMCGENLTRTASLKGSGKNNGRSE
jgi:hypothetical protein